MNETQVNASAVEIGQKLFKYRDYTPVPLIILLLMASSPTIASATVGTVIVCLGELFRVYAVAFIGGVSRTRSSSTGQSLITNGPFAFVRNPLYVGNFIICLGVSVFSASGPMVVLTCVAFAFQYYCIVKYEETLLLERFGEEYERYLQNVPAWIPRRVPNLDDIEWPQSLSPGIRSESRTLTAIGFILFILVILAHRN